MTKYFIIILCVVIMAPFAGCKKKQGFDPMAKGRNDFIGTWTGSISTFKNNKLLKESGNVMIYLESESSLTGILFMNETIVFHEFQILNGTLYFKIPCNDPLNPTCQNWSLGGYAVFTEEGKIDIRISGNQCGPFGSEYIDWNGSLVKTVISADSIPYNSFAKTGNSWTYKTTLKNGDTCQVQKQINSGSSNFVFQGVSTQTCGWNGSSIKLKWVVSPASFSILTDSTFCLSSFDFPINAKPGVVYSSILHNDTNTVSLLDTNLLVKTDAGNFYCNRFRYTEPVISGDGRIIKRTLLWLNNRYGVIRQEVENPVDSTDVQVQVLSAKNF
ncbi:MAG: hypothetical protein WCK34_02025 [Bacteroidota bacterium]